MKKIVLILIFFPVLIVSSAFAGGFLWTWTDLANEPVSLVLLGSVLIGLGNVSRKKELL